MGKRTAREDYERAPIRIRNASFWCTPVGVLFLLGGIFEPATFAAGAIIILGGAVLRALADILIELRAPRDR